jgi:hypothetical protein
MGAVVGVGGRSDFWWLQLFAAEETLAQEYVKAHASKVGDIMVREVVTAAPEASLDEIRHADQRRHGRSLGNGEFPDRTKGHPCRRRRDGGVRAVNDHLTVRPYITGV